MTCEFCKKDRRILTLVPVEGPKGELVSMACIPCATKHGVYCQDHNQPHLGFAGKTHACVQCVNDDVKRLLDRSTDVANLILKNFELDACAEIAEHCTEWAQATRVSIQSQLIRPIVLLAHRSGRTFDEMLAIVIKNKDVAAFTQGTLPNTSTTIQ